MLISLLCLFLTMAVLWYIIRTDAVPHRMKNLEPSASDEQQRLQMDEALHEISPEEASAQRRRLEFK